MEDETNKPEESVNPGKLLTELAKFTGNGSYYRHGLNKNVLYTEGVQHLCESAGCYWLLDIIASYQPDLAKHDDHRLHGMQFWTLTVNADNTAVVTCVADAGEEPAIKQEIGWTDFPMESQVVWVGVGPEGGTVTALLASEY